MSCFCAVKKVRSAFEAKHNQSQRFGSIHSGRVVWNMGVWETKTSLGGSHYWESPAHVSGFDPSTHLALHSEEWELGSFSFSSVTKTC